MYQNAFFKKRQIINSESSSNSSTSQSGDRLFPVKIYPMAILLYDQNQSQMLTRHIYTLHFL